MGLRMEGNTPDTGAPSTEVKSYSEAEVKALLEKETAGLKSKVDELLGEKKSVSQKAKEAADRAEREAAERAKADGDYKSLLDSSESKRAEIEQKYKELTNSIRNEKRSNEAMRLATEMASGTNAELMASFIEKRLDINEEGKLMVLDGDGNPTVSTLSDLKKEFVSSGRFDALIDGTKASGGGAATTKAGGAGATKKKLSDMSRAEKIQYFNEKKGA